MVQDLMDKKEIELSDSIDPSINVITGTTYLGTLSSTGTTYLGTLSSTGRRPITIFHDNEEAKNEMPKVPIPILMVEDPRPFSYKSQKAVPWDYNCNYTHQTTATDLTSVGGITRNDCCYAPDMIKKVTPEKLLMSTSQE